LACRAVNVTGGKRTSEDLVSDEPPPALDQDFESSFNSSREHVWLQSICVHKALTKHVI